MSDKKKPKKQSQAIYQPPNRRNNQVTKEQKAIHEPSINAQGLQKPVGDGKEEDLAESLGNMTLEHIVQPKDPFFIPLATNPDFSDYISQLLQEYDLDPIVGECILQILWTDDEDPQKMVSLSEFFASIKHEMRHSAKDFEKVLEQLWQRWLQERSCTSSDLEPWISQKLLQIGLEDDAYSQYIVQLVQEMSDPRQPLEELLAGANVNKEERDSLIEQIIQRAKAPKKTAVDASPNEGTTEPTKTTKKKPKWTPMSMDELSQWFDDKRKGNVEAFGSRDSPYQASHTNVQRNASAVVAKRMIRHYLNIKKSG